MPHTRKGEENHDPFWDSWDDDELPVVVERKKHRPTSKKITKKIAALASDPFGRDGFGDNWDYKPATLPIDDDDDPPPEEDFSGAEFDWGLAAARARACREAEQAKRTKKREDLMRLRAKAAAEVKAAAEANAAEAGAAAKAFAEKEWKRRSKLAMDCLALANPVQALNILYDLSLDVEITEQIDSKEKRSNGQLYTAIFDHQDVQKSLCAKFVNCSYLGRPSDMDESTVGGDTVKVNPSNTDDTTVGGDTIKVNLSREREDEENSESEIASIGTNGETETDRTTVVVDRLPTGLKRDTNKSSCYSESTIGGDTNKLFSSNYQSASDDEKENEINCSNKD